MKPAVAKVVNPLGTVVNVHLDDDINIEPIEEDVIHENCDEALFRPFVASKTVAYHSKVKRYGDDIITKSLEGTTEVTVKVLKKSEKNKPKSRECSPAKPKSVIDNDCPLKPPKHGNKSGSSKKSCSMTDLKQNDTYSKSRKLKTNLVVATEDSFTVSSDIVLDLPPPLDNEDFFSLENISKIDTFEDAVDCESISICKKDRKVSTKKENVYVDEDDILAEEKIYPKKNRKLKTELGVKSVNINTVSSITEKTFEDCSAEITLPTPPKRSWSSVAASKSNEKSLIDSIENKKPPELPPIEFIEEFIVTLPRKQGCQPISDLIDISTPKEEKLVKGETVKDFLDVSRDVNLIKIDKSSDDEKGESSSSQAEVTESDDSGQVPDVFVSDNMTESKTVAVTKSSRKKKKRK